MKKCSRCKEEKNETEFHKDRTKKDGLDLCCKKCRSIQHKKAREKNPEHYREACRRSAIKNYENIRACQKKFRLENRERILKRRRELREPRKKEINERESLRRKNDPNFLIKNRKRYKKWYQENKQKLKPKHNAHNLIMYAIKLGILTRGTECEICGSKLKIEGHHEDYSKPLEVKWWCKSCHAEHHAKNKE